MYEAKIAKGVHIKPFLPIIFPRTDLGINSCAHGTEAVSEIVRQRENIDIVKKSKRKTVLVSSL